MKKVVMEKYRNPDGHIIKINQISNDMINPIGEYFIPEGQEHLIEKIMKEFCIFFNLQFEISKGNV